MVKLHFIETEEKYNENERSFQMESRAPASIQRKQMWFKQVNSTYKGDTKAIKQNVFP